jgi:hypothetical protein
MRAIRWQKMRYVNSGANVVPDIALSTVVLNLKLLTCERTGDSKQEYKKESEAKNSARFLKPVSFPVHFYPYLGKCQVTTNVTSL